MEWLEGFVLLIEATLRVSTPLIFAALGGMLSERSGVINIALEGMMLFGAFGAAVVALTTQSPWAGAFGAAVIGVLVAAIYALFVIEFRADQIVSGTAINILAAGVTPFFLKVLYDSTTSSPSVPIENRFQYAPVLAAWFFVFTLWYWIRRTPSGIWVRFAGEHPAALDSAGVQVKKVRWLCVMGSGLLAGLGGATLSIFMASSFTRNMTAGRGFMALAALIFGKWRPIPAAFACLFFGFADAIQSRLQGVILWGSQPVPVQFIQILPYVVTILVLAGFVGRASPPKSLGLPFLKS